MSFKFWSQNNKSAKEALLPKLGLRAWGVLDKDEKYKIWKYLEIHFFDKEPRKDYNHPQNENGIFYQFYGNFTEQENIRLRIMRSIYALNDAYKAKSFARRFLENPKPNSAFADFFDIFLNENENVVYELLSIYAKCTILEREKEEVYRLKGQTDDAYQKDLKKWRWAEFDNFTKNFNTVFGEFGINVYLTRGGLISRKDKKITEDIYEPVLIALSDPEWGEVNKLLGDSFEEYRKTTSAGYSNSVTNTVAAVQAFLQILILGKTGREDISKLIPMGLSKKLIPSDIFSQNAFKNIASTLAKERQETGIAHPKKEYATAKNARLVLNLAMTFIQHCLQPPE